MASVQPILAPNGDRFRTETLKHKRFHYCYGSRTGAGTGILFISPEDSKLQLSGPLALFLQNTWSKENSA
jgi:hypothetical protein